MCTAFEQDKVCHWIVTDYIQPWNDTCPCCTLVTTPCVEVTPALCDDEFRVGVGFVCHCCNHDEYGNYGAPYNIGSGTKCPTS
jgi:hypothetical protein